MTNKKTVSTGDGEEKVEIIDFNIRKEKEVKSTSYPIVLVLEHFVIINRNGLNEKIPNRWGTKIKIGDLIYL